MRWALPALPSLADADAIHAMVEMQMVAKMKDDQQLVRQLLGHWVSECEPAIAVGPDQEILGLCLAETDVGDSPFILTPEACGIDERSPA